MPIDPDVLRTTWGRAVWTVLRQLGLDQWLLHPVCFQAVPLVGLIVWLGCVLAVTAGIEWLGRARHAAVRQVTLVLAVAATAALFVQLHRAPSPTVNALCNRWDQMAFAALAGVLLAHLPGPWRAWAIVALSLDQLALAMGRLALPILVPNLAALLVGWALWVRLGTFSGPVVFVTQAIAPVVLLCVALWERPGMPLEAAGVAGLLASSWMRQVSFVVDARRGAPGRLGGYLAYQLFWPVAQGSIQLWDEFRPAITDACPPVDRRASVARIVRGSAYLFLAGLLWIEPASVFDAHTTAAAWTGVLHAFVFGALWAMGTWGINEGVGGLYGVPLRANFTGVLTARNPGAFWRAWRGTMSQWLIRYVYIPLGGNRQHQRRNIAAVFLVSAIWHWQAVPFGPQAFSAIGLWAAASALGVIVYVSWKGLGLRLTPAGTPSWLRALAQIAGTWVFAAFTIFLLGTHTANLPRLRPILRLLAGLG